MAWDDFPFVTGAVSGAVGVLPSGDAKVGDEGGIDGAILIVVVIVVSVVGGRSCGCGGRRRGSYIGVCGRGWSSVGWSGIGWVSVANIPVRGIGVRWIAVAGPEPTSTISGWSSGGKGRNSGKEQNAELHPESCD